MKHKLIAVVTTLCLVLCDPTLALAGWCGVKARPPIDLRSLSSSTGEMFRGPQTIVVTYINPLRYDYSWTTVSSFGNTPDLWSKLSSPSGSANTPEAKPAITETDHTTSKTNANDSVRSLKQMLPAPLGGTAARGVKAKGEASNETLQLALQTSQLYLGAQDLFTSVDDENEKIAKLERGDGSAADISLFKLREDIIAQQRSAASATSAIKLSGTRLIALLQSSDPLIKANGNLATQINTLRDSTWTSSLNTAWPSQSDLDALRTRLRHGIDDTAALRSEASPFIITASRDLGTTRTNLQTLQTKLLARQVTVELNPNLRITDAATISSSVNKAQELADLIRKHENVVATFSSRVDRLSTIGTELGAILDDISATGEKYKNFSDAQQMLNVWDGRLTAALSAAAYTISKEVTCEYAFARTKQVKISLVRTDMMPGTTASSPTTYDLGTMECASPFDVSAGVAFSSITEREFAIHAVPNSPGSSTTTNRLVTTSHSNFHPLPLALVSARVCEPNEVIAVGAGFGVAASIKGDSSGGSAAEYLLGPTIMLFRAVFITPGLHIGRDVRLGDGFKEGDAVPTSITSPPLKKSYKPAFGFSITFTRP